MSTAERGADSDEVRRPEDLTAPWLNTALASSGLLGPGEQVRSFSYRPVGTGQMADTVRITLDTMSGPVPGAGNRRTLIAKFASADEDSRSTGLMTRAYEIEVAFYGAVAGRVTTRIPGCHYGRVDPETGWFVLLLEDIEDAAPGQQLDGCTVEAAGAALSELAALHGPAWGDPELKGLECLRRSGPEADAFLAGLVTSVWQGFVDRYGDRLEARHLEVGAHLMTVLEPWLAARPAGTTVVHGDFRLDNLLFPADGTHPYVVDWQTAVWGPAASDVAYFIGASLSVDDRRRHGDELVRSYHEALVGHGVTGYSLDDLHADIRRLCFWGVVMTVGASMLVKRTERGDDLFVESMARYSQQAIDLDAEAVLPHASPTGVDLTRTQPLRPPRHPTTGDR